MLLVDMNLIISMLTTFTEIQFVINKQLAIQAEARHLIEVTMPEIPKPELPYLSKIPTLPKPEFPEIPKPELPTLPKPVLPEIPKLELPTFPKPELPTLLKLEISVIPKPKLQTFSKPESPDQVPKHP
ncbi:hypothetical protein T459_14379 [Capsicum annuum]|uniref:Periaxin-like n=1 Tax=Capsicum annuum TaxID=4072 RepID=A0A2G2ZHE7_CAPAN|nr:hypothetical protein T459_14379 [Capsicum annuum]